MKKQGKFKNPNAVADVGQGLRLMVRAAAIAVLFVSFLHGLTVSEDEHDNPMRNWRGKVAAMVGLAADNIRISGVELHEPTQVLEAIGVKPGGSLIGFDADGARRQLSQLDWVETASVERIFPNQLAISLQERKAFAIWQNEGQLGVIDQTGKLMSGVSPTSFHGLPLVTGLGANTAVAELVNQIEATPNLKAKVRAAARVGQRRWNLYLDNGVKIALPDGDVRQALQTAETLDREQGIFSKGITQLDLRLKNEVVVALAVVEQDVPPNGKVVARQ